MCACTVAGLIFDFLIRGCKHHEGVVRSINLDKQGLGCEKQENKY